MFVSDKDSEEYSRIVSSMKNPEDVILHGEIHPADRVAVIANSKLHTPTVFGMKWGYTEFGKLIFNTRSETAGEKKIFRDGIMNRRCLIPVVCYFEWDGNKRKYRIESGEGKLIFLGGIYRRESDMPVFSVLTREPTALLGRIHNRMPVIIPEESIRDWLSEKGEYGGIIHNSFTDLSFATV